MRLNIRQQVFSLVDRFSIMNDQGQERYYAEGEFFTWGRKLHVYDRSGYEVLYIEQKLFTFLHRYRIYCHGSYAAELVREFSLFYPSFTVEGPDWRITGSPWEHEYSMYRRDGHSAAVVSREWFTWGDCYTLDVERPEDELLALGVLLGLDCIRADHASH